MHKNLLKKSFKKGHKIVFDWLLHIYKSFEYFKIKKKENVFHYKSNFKIVVANLLSFVKKKLENNLKILLKNVWY